MICWTTTTVSLRRADRMMLKLCCNAFQFHWMRSIVPQLFPTRRMRQIIMDGLWGMGTVVVVAEAPQSVTVVFSAASLDAPPTLIV